ncbi:MULTISPECIES: hypothetical protein [Rhodococcus]|uniref:Uncharacterized protein n=1 Tax=Rhodococcus opacus RKJ300 = JCM 13270 TaxID=1165867 RepID=I0WWN4_RHOOP|nr:MULTISPECIES: hypothetical protein [Rhodococcus]EID80800.1 hypothetical protein W59_06318 [Rhodococcus opacus RKJ300 = JCM 13270]QQZ15225.1 hypothetical protein GO592_03170 [Rhodococcus sp. 21391]
MTLHDQIIQLATRRPYVLENYVATQLGVGHHVARHTLRELEQTGHLIGTRRRGYSFGYLSAILDRIEQVGSASGRDLAEHFGILPHCIAPALAALVDAGQISESSDGYQISPKP